MKSTFRYHLWYLILCILFISVVPGAAQEPPKRIVSTAPSVTELICALGLQDNLVGVTTFCDRPREVKKIRKVGGPANPSLEAIIRLKPDVVIVDEEGIGVRLSQTLKRFGIKTIVFRGARLSKLPGAIRTLGHELGVSQKAQRLAQSIEQSSEKPVRQSPPVRTLFIVWPDPLISVGAGTLINDILLKRGFEPAIVQTRALYPHLSYEAILKANPSLIIVGQGHTIQGPVQQMLKHIAKTDAAQHHAVCLVSDALFRPGPRIAEGIAEIEQCLMLVRK